MDFTLSEDQSLQVAACERFTRERCTIEVRRAQAREPAGTPSPLWPELVALGIGALLVPEDRGGLGRPPIDAALALQALGAGLLLEPVIDSAVTATTVLSRAPRTPETDTWLARLVEGAVVVPLQVEPATGTPGATMAGVARHVGTADAVLALAGSTGGDGRSGDEPRLLLFEAGALERIPWRQVDGTPAGRVRAALADAIVIADGPAARAAWQAGVAMGVVGRIAEGLGLSRAALDLTAEYLRTRQQFGQPLARFQALAHRMAELLVDWELAQSLAWAAAMDPDGPQGARRLLAGQVRTQRMLRKVSQDTVQLHGGIGMTDDYALSHLVKRMLAVEFEMGPVDRALMRYAALAEED